MSGAEEMNGEEKVVECGRMFEKEVRCGCIEEACKDRAASLLQMLFPSSM
jgi:hypothetical protein